MRAASAVSKHREYFSLLKTPCMLYQGKLFYSTCQSKHSWLETSRPSQMPHVSLFSQIWICGVLFVILLMSEMYYYKQQHHNIKKEISSQDKWMELYQICCCYTDFPAANLTFYVDSIKARQKNLYEKVEYFNWWQVSH